MLLCDLAAQSQTDAGPARLGGEEGNEQVGGVGQTEAFVLYPHFEVTGVLSSPDLDRAFGFQSCVDTIADKIDQELLQLVSIRLDQHVRAGTQGYREPRLQ